MKLFRMLAIVTFIFCCCAQATHAGVFTKCAMKLTDGRVGFVRNGQTSTDQCNKKAKECAKSNNWSYEKIRFWTRARLLNDPYEICEN